jgi:hypothetical protein
MKLGYVFGGSLMVLAALGCAGSSKYQVTGSARAPDADGRITVEKVEGGNSMVKLDLDHLAPPERMEKGATTYVVWFHRQGAPPARVGQLAYDTGKRMGTMRATTTDRQFDVVVTAEPSGAVAAPSNVVVFEKQVETP